MKKLLILLLMLPAICFAMNYQTMFEHLKKANNLKVKITLGDYGGNSYTDQSGVHIDKEMVKYCFGNYDCVIGMVAHELGHVKLRHIETVAPNNSKTEDEADIASVSILRNAGCNPCSMAVFLQIQKPYILPSEHSSVDVRIKNIMRICK